MFSLTYIEGAFGVVFTPGVSWRQQAYFSPGREMEIPSAVNAGAKLTGSAGLPLIVLIANTVCAKTGDDKEEGWGWG